jgi:hypothetical protein
VADEDIQSLSLLPVISIRRMLMVITASAFVAWAVVAALRGAPWGAGIVVVLVTLIVVFICLAVGYFALWLVQLVTIGRKPLVDAAVQSGLTAPQLVEPTRNLVQ